jgi:hypothetical protein
MRVGSWGNGVPGWRSQGFLGSWIFGSLGREGSVWTAGSEVQGQLFSIADVQAFTRRGALSSHSGHQLEHSQTHSDGTNMARSAVPILYTQTGTTPKTVRFIYTSPISQGVAVANLLISLGWLKYCMLNVRSITNNHSQT